MDYCLVPKSAISDINAKCTKEKGFLSEELRLDLMEHGYTTCTLQHYDARHYPYLVFAFRANKNVELQRLINDYIVTEESGWITYYDLDGFVVLSHYINKGFAMDVPPNIEKIAVDCQGDKDFGDRPCSRTLGFYSFTGGKNTVATVDLH
eukprot:15236608-Ditylum_brightwellii.AAC.1